MRLLPKAARWSLVALVIGIGAPTAATVSVVTTIAIHPTTPATLYAGTRASGVFFSTAAGGSWTAFNTGLSNLTVNAIAIDPKSPSIVYAASNGGVFRSTTGGGSWIQMNTGLRTLAVLTLAIDPQATRRSTRARPTAASTRRRPPATYSRPSTRGSAASSAILQCTRSRLTRGRRASSTRGRATASF